MKLLGLFDILASFLFFLSAFAVELPIWLLIVFGVYLIIKGLLFVFLSTDVGSFIDIAGGSVLVGSHYAELSITLFVVFGLVFLIKGGFSFA
ncbi:MAG TPA: hypothetical protein VJ103_00450 [Candidatus Paceibacterota bacterium]|nr:hypothetical protein [Candidatus Paceibacterota bacterium]